MFMRQAAGWSEDWRFGERCNLCRAASKSRLVAEHGQGARSREQSKEWTRSFGMTKTGRGQRSRKMVWVMFLKSTAQLGVADPVLGIIERMLSRWIGIHEKFFDIIGRGLHDMEVIKARLRNACRLLSWAIGKRQKRSSRRGLGSNMMR